MEDETMCDDCGNTMESVDAYEFDGKTLCIHCYNEVNK